LKPREAWVSNPKLTSAKHERRSWRPRWASDGVLLAPPLRWHRNLFTFLTSAEGLPVTPSTAWTRARCPCSRPPKKTTYLATSPERWSGRSKAIPISFKPPENGSGGLQDRMSSGYKSPTAEEAPSTHSSEQRRTKGPGYRASALERAQYLGFLLVGAPPGTRPAAPRLVRRAWLEPKATTKR
jgi:hypothetical protein